MVLVAISFPNVEKRFQKTPFMTWFYEKNARKDKKKFKNVCSIQKSRTFAPENDWAMV
jgi:hypothetical protein